MATPGPQYLGATPFPIFALYMSSGSQKDGDKADQTVVDAYESAPRAGDANIFDESQRLKFGSQHLLYEALGLLNMTLNRRHPLD